MHSQFPGNRGSAQPGIQRGLLRNLDESPNDVTTAALVQPPASKRENFRRHRDRVTKGVGRAFLQKQFQFEEQLHRTLSGVV